MGFYGDLHQLNFVKGLNMTETTSAANVPGVKVLEPKDPLADLEARLTELENVVHALAPGMGDKHNVLVAWLEKIGARIKAAL